MTFEQVKLGDVADMLSGFAFKSAEFLDHAEEGVLLVRGDNVQQGFIRWGEKAKKWRSDAYDDLSRYHLQKDDVILAMDRPIVGGGLKLAWIKDQDLPSLLVQRVTRIRGFNHKARTNFLRYVLSTPGFLAHIDRITTGANIPHISGKDIASFTFQLPDLDVQDRIVDFIAAYDDLIENNQRRIALLEESARLLYREWFVNLRFPGFASVPLTLGVPAGWSKAAIAEQTTFLNRGITPSYNESAPGLIINQKCIREGRLSMLPARRQSKEVKPERLIQKGDVLINSTGAGTLGRVAQVRSPVENCTVDTHVTIARPIGNEWATYFGQALLSLEPTFSAMGKGATNQLELNRADIGAIEIWRPPVAVALDFHELVWPMLEHAENLLSANQKLVEARDALLPKLMSGKIQV